MWSFSFHVSCREDRNVERARDARKGNASYRHCTAASADLLAHMLSSKLDCQDKDITFGIPVHLCLEVMSSSFWIQLKKFSSLLPWITAWCVVAVYWKPVIYYLWQKQKKKKEKKRNLEGRYFRLQDFVNWAGKAILIVVHKEAGGVFPKEI